MLVRARNNVPYTVKFATLRAFMGQPLDFLRLRGVANLLDDTRRDSGATPHRLG